MILNTIACCLLLAIGQVENDRWEKAIQRFESQDQTNPPPSGSVLFVGSSSIRMWDLSQSFPELKTINRGFGGSQMSDVLRYADRIVFPYRPRTIVLYEGDNDVAAGEDAGQLVSEYKRFARQVRRRLPETTLVILAIKPSIARWELWPDMQQANQQLADFCSATEKCHFVDVSQVMLDDEGRPMTELFVDDGLHLNATGYARWTRLVRPLVERQPSR